MKKNNKLSSVNGYDFDAQEDMIIRQLIRDPRISDNQIAKNTGVPLKSVNRKRGLLEKNGLIEYYVGVNNGFEGTKKFMSKELVLIKFKLGLSRKNLVDNLIRNQPAIFSKHLLCMEIGESSGVLVLVLVIESRVNTDILEIINLEIVPALRQRLGQDCVSEIDTMTLTKTLRVLHNYLPGHNTKDGKMIEGWPDNLIHV